MVAVSRQNKYKLIIHVNEAIQTPQRNDLLIRVAMAGDAEILLLRLHENGQGSHLFAKILEVTFN